MAGQASDLSKKEVDDYPYGPRAPVLPESLHLKAEQAQLRESLTNGTAQTLIACIGVALAFGLGNFVVFPLCDAVNPQQSGFLFVFVLFGAICAQGGLISAGLVFGPGRFWLRTVCCWGVSAFLWLCWAVGLMAYAYSRRWRYPADWHEMLQFVGLSLPLVAVAIQSPLWFARSYLGWRLAPSDGSETAAQPLSIGDYFVGTAVTAVSITCAQLGRPAQWVAPAYWPAWAIVVACVAAASLLGVLPAMLLILRWRHWRLGFCLLVLYGTVAGVALISTLIAVFGPPGQIWEVLGMVVIFISTAAFLGAGMIVARACGYSLVMGRDKER